jgi:uncharacterized protein DUF4149
MRVGKSFGWTGWLLVVVYLGALTAISGFIAKWLFFSNEFSYYQVFFEVVVSAGVLYVLTQVYKTLRNKDSESKWWNRGLKLLAVIFGFMGLCTFVVGYGLYSSLEESERDPVFDSLDSETQKYIVQGTYTFGTLFIVSSALAFTAMVGLPLHRRFGWYAAVTLILIQIVAVTGLLDKERATYFVMPPIIAREFDETQVHQAEMVFVPLVMNGVFIMLIANIVIVTFLTLPRVLASFNMPTDILSARLGKGH